MTDPQFANLDALVTLISSSVQTIKDEWHEKGISPPLLDGTSPHPADDGASQSVAMKKALRVLEGACAQLVASTVTPGHFIINTGMNIFTMGCLRVVYEAKVAEHLDAAGSQGLHVSDIAAKTGIDSGKLARILRLLASRHIFREVNENVFANNRMSVHCQSKDSLNSLVGHLMDEAWSGSFGLYDALVDPKFGPSYAPELAPVARVRDLKGLGLFPWYTQTEEGSSRGIRFADGMVGWTAGVGAGDFTKVYPWGSLREGATVTDVGAGVGHVSMTLAKEYPSLKFIVQDLPAVIEDGKKVWETQFPEALEQQRVQLVPIDFLKESPVAGSDVYFLKHVVHDWADKESSILLSNIRKVMKPDSKLVIAEYILQHSNRVPDAEALSEQAPLPLLPNYGVGGLRQYNLDLEMMCMTNSKERTQREFVDLGTKAGLKVLSLFDTGEISLIEFGLDPAFQT